MPNYHNVKKFMELLHRFHTVDRIAGVPTLSRSTNAVEHSYQLVMLAWYVVSTQKLPLNIDLVFKYALAHDIVEAYAGDTPTFDTEGRKTKDAREKEAYERIVSEFPEFPQLREILEAYEKREDSESRFVYALDKFIDPLNSVMTTDRDSVWKEYNISYDSHFEYKDPKIASSEYVAPLWERLSEELKQNKDFFFPN